MAPAPSPIAPRPATPGGRLTAPVIVILLGGLTGAALMHVWVRLQQIQTGYALSQASREAKHLAETHKRLRIEAAVLKHPGRIERIARTRLRMGAPDPEQIHVVRVPARRTAQPRHVEDPARATAPAATPAATAGTATTAATTTTAAPKLARAGGER